MAKQEQEYLDFWSFQDEFIIDYSLFEEDLFAQANGEDFLALSALNDHAQQQQQQQQKELWPDHTLEDFIRSLEDGVARQLEPPIPPLPQEQVEIKSDFVTKVEAPKTSSNPTRKRKRIKGWKNTPEGIKHRAMAKERQRIRNREAAAKSHAKKQKYVKDLELQYGDLRRENAVRKRVLKFLEISMEVGTLPRKLERTTSGPVTGY